MTESDPLHDQIVQLENAATYGGGEELLRLAALLLQNPQADPHAAQWVGHRITQALDNYYAGATDEPFTFHRGDKRKSASRRGRDRRNGLSWPAAILFEHATLSLHGRRGMGIFERIASRLRRGGYSFSASTVRDTYYQAIDDPNTLRELETFSKRFNFTFPKTRRLSGK